jgi:hypothetical protein
VTGRLAPDRQPLDVRLQRAQHRLRDDLLLPHPGPKGRPQQGEQHEADHAGQQDGHQDTDLEPPMVVQVRLGLRGRRGRVVVARKDAHRLEATDQLGRSVAGRRQMSFRPTRGCP